MLRPALLTTLMLLPNISQAATCSIDQNRLQSSIDTIQTSYQSKFKQRSDAAEKDANTIKRDTPQPDDVEAVIGFDVEVGSHIEEIKVNIPEFTMQEQRISLHLPEVTMKQQEWIFHTPSTRMRLQCVNGPIEFVCEDKEECVGGGATRICITRPSCHTRAGPQICTDIPEIFMQEQKVILGVPEVKMTQQDIILNLPAVTMRLQTWKLTVPDITVKNVKAEFKKSEDRAKQLQEREKNAMTALSSSMQSEIKATTAPVTKSYIACSIKQIDEDELTALKDIDNNIAAVSAAIESASKNGAKDLEASMRGALKTLLDARADVSKQFAEAKEKINDKVAAAASVL